VLLDLPASLSRSLAESSCDLLVCSYGTRTPLETILGRGISNVAQRVPHWWWGVVACAGWNLLAELSGL